MSSYEDDALILPGARRPARAGITLIPAPAARSTSPSAALEPGPSAPVPEMHPIQPASLAAKGLSAALGGGISIAALARSRSVGSPSTIAGATSRARANDALTGLAHRAASVVATAAHGLEQNNPHARGRSPGMRDEIAQQLTSAAVAPSTRALTQAAAVAGTRSPAVRADVGELTEAFKELVEAFTPNPREEALLGAFVRGHWGGPRFTRTQYVQAVRLERSHEGKPWLGVVPERGPAEAALLKRGIALEHDIPRASTPEERARLEGALSAVALVLWLTSGGGAGGILPGAPRWGH